MNAPLSRVLREAYDCAVYEAELETGHVIFRIGRAPQGPAPDGTLAIITAWNPAHERPGDPANKKANVRLAAEIESRGWQHRPALGRSEDGAHVEASFAVADIAREEAVAIGRRLNQAAVFYWDGTEARILSCMAEEQSA
ncbi:MAG: DUF3293 domain-containing protein [Gammaproteobacteria bacterium]